MSLVVFYILGGAILLSAIMVVTLRNVFHSALFLVLTFFLVAGIYLMLHAEFLAAVQVLIYVGAVTILILFAIMLTYNIQSKSVRQVNEQVAPAIIIAVLFLALAAFSLVTTFKGTAPKSTAQPGVWTASLDLSRLSSDSPNWNWTVNIEDKNGKSYVAGGFFSISKKDGVTKAFPSRKTGQASGYILSAAPDFSTMDRIFSNNQTAYLKVWSDKLDVNSLSKAIWTISGTSDGKMTVELKSGTNRIDTIGRLLMSKFVLPFEIVSVLLLAALIGAIVIARKDA